LDAARGRRPCREGSREGPADPDRVKPGEVLSRGAPCAPAAIALSDGAKRSRCCPSPARRDNYCPLLWPSAAAPPPSPPRLPPPATRATSEPSRPVLPRAGVGAGGISPSSSAFISSSHRPGRSFLFPPVSPADSTYSSAASYACLFPRVLTNSDLRERRNGVTSRSLSVLADQSLSLRLGAGSARGSVACVRRNIIIGEA
jgi:hypothetical protein